MPDGQGYDEGLYLNILEESFCCLYCCSLYYCSSVMESSSRCSCSVIYSLGLGSAKYSVYSCLAGMTLALWMASWISDKIYVASLGPSLSLLLSSLLISWLEGMRAGARIVAGLLAKSLLCLIMVAPVLKEKKSSSFRISASRLR